ncbi:MAG: epoxyqueuosine reductase QueH [Spirochaetia bacterium]|nr:epoxyqueuosine reductase QueH [Spirochaetia bacterium]
MTNAKVNYQKELEKVLSLLTPDGKEKPSLLLHACCAPCSSHVLSVIARYFDITVYYYNPNIHPELEYTKRLTELKKFLQEFPEAKRTNVLLKEENYNPQEYFDASKVLIETELQTEREKGERCRRCYKFRMEKAFHYAVANNFDFFTTTLSISPHKDSQAINEIGLELEKTSGQTKTKFLQSDFKKNNGFLHSLELSKEFNLYRQDYCGCVYSMQNKN